MGLAVIVLVGALATGSNHVKSIGEGFQLASVPEPTTPAPSPDVAAAETLPAPDPEPEPDEPSPFKAAPPSDVTEVDPVVEPEPAPVEPTSEPPVEAEVALEATSPVRIATGQELGGRIVSVKSENVSLEWSPESPPESD
jgi:hypothetical protein